MKRIILSLLSLTTTLAMAQHDNQAPKYADMITENGLREKLTILSGADMEGRETASPGQKKAAAYIESQFKRFGLLPGNNGSYQMLYPVYQDELTAEKLSINGTAFVWDRDYSISLNNISSGSWTYTSVIFVGYGVVDSVNNINDYTGLDVKGKLVVVLDGNAPGRPADPAPAGGARGRGPRGGPSSAFAKSAAARKAGAAALVIISANFPLATPTETKGRMSLTPAAATNAIPFPIVNASASVGSALLGKVGTAPSDFQDVAKGDHNVNVTISATRTNQVLESSNVIGLLPGTDKKDEYVFLTGHYDHLGKRGNVIWYGADDDGSGSVSVIQMAEAFSKAAREGHGPRRSIVFMTVSGEEKGLLGSQYYSEHPVFPLDKTTVDLNTDMDGRIDTERKLGDTLNYIYVIGHDKLSSDLPVINEAMNNKYTKLTLDYKYDDPTDQNRIYYRSDHYNFAKKGVPILFFYDGMLLADYHKPTDTIEKINFPLMQKRVQLVFYTAWEMANRDDMLKRDTPLNMPNSR